jgi:hypothetical protein
MEYNLAPLPLILTLFSFWLKPSNKAVPPIPMSYSTMLEDLSSVKASWRYKEEKNSNVKMDWKECPGGRNEEEGNKGG